MYVLLLTFVQYCNIRRVDHTVVILKEWIRNTSKHGYLYLLEPVQHVYSFEYGGAGVVFAVKIDPHR